MPARYLLDTNILSSLIKDPQGPVTKRLAQLDADAICTSIVVACELRYGAAKRGSVVLTQRVEDLLGAIEVMPFEGDADRQYAEIRATLERAGDVFAPSVALKVDPDAPAADDPYSDPAYQVPDDLMW